jgi:hypothetical protein
MPTTFLQAVTLPERCLLHEVLLWVAFQRLPVAIYNERGGDVRERPDDDGYVIEQVPDASLDEEECTRAGIPIDPRYIRYGPGSEDLFEKIYRRDLEPEEISDLIQQSEKEKQQFEKDCASWELHYKGAIEYPASQVFVALRGGQLRARGRLLPSVDYDEEKVELFRELPEKEIPSAFWTLKGIDFESSAAKNESEHYCHITLRMADVLSFFSGEREETVSVERIGNTYVLESAKHVAQSVNRGRPSYPWDRFHLEVTALLLRHELPKKKEAAIQYFQAWFSKVHGIQPSRAAIGEKLKPYYDSFLKDDGQKI